MNNLPHTDQTSLFRGHCLEQLEQCLDNDLLSDTDVQFARFMAQLNGDANDELLVAACLISHARSRKQSSLTLDAIARHPVMATIMDIDSKHLASQLLKQRVVSHGQLDTPLVIFNDRLYLNRFLTMELSIAYGLRQRNQPLAITHTVAFKETLNILFPESRTSGGETDWQLVAAIVGSTRQFSLICGGPGTGKTTTVIKLLLLSTQQFFLRHHRLPVIRLAAPTGKAAFRLSQAIEQARHTFQQNDHHTVALQAIPREASTLHRLLGPLFASDGLHCDILVLDELSMIDLNLMSQLLNILPTSCQLIALGDPDQLSSVEPGSVLADFCHSSNMNAFSDAQHKIIAQYTDALPGQSLTSQNRPLQDCVCMLKKSYRFKDTSGIGRLAKAIKEHNPDDHDSWQNYACDSVHVLRYGQSSLNAVIETICNHWSALMALPLCADNTRQILTHLGKVQALCATRKGDGSVQAINRQVEDALKKRGLIRPNSDGYYPGKPVMIESNDYDLNVFNGDIGVILKQSQHQSSPQVACFLDQTGSVKMYMPNMLPQHSTVYAMTVHKSQGSEFDHCIVVLKQDRADFVNKELVYTAITRARNQLTLIVDGKSISQYLTINNGRTSGLEHCLGMSATELKTLLDSVEESTKPG